MDECLLLVDNSNVFIEGGKFAARQKGILKRVHLLDSVFDRIGKYETL
jgi:hypothetical protein